MANIFCTNKLEKIIGKQNIQQLQVDNVIGNWNANVFFVNRRKFLYLINDQTCYSIILPNFIKKSIGKFHQLFYQRLFEQYQYDQIIIDSKLKCRLLESPINFMKTNNNRKIIGTMTQFIKDIEYYLYCHHEQLNLIELNNRMTNNFVSVFKEKKYEMDSPIELMQKAINEVE